MEQSRGGGFFWVLMSRGDTAQLQQRENAEWEPAYRPSEMHGFVVLGQSNDWAIWEIGPRLPAPPPIPPSRGSIPWERR